MRHGRFITTALVAVAAMAIGPAVAAAAPSPLTDDAPADFSAGTPGSATSATDAPGSVRLVRTMKTEQFDAGLPTSLAATLWSPPAGTAAVAAGALSVDGARVADVRDYVPGQSLEFRATFSNASSEHVGFGKTLEAGPWAIFTTGDGGAGADLRVSTQPLDASAPVPVPAMVDAIPGVDKTLPHTYRIDWSATKVDYSVDGVLKVTHNLVAPNTFTDQLHPVISDFAADSSAVSIDSLGMQLFPDSGQFESRVQDAGDARAVWGALTSTVVGGGATFETRSGKTPNPNDLSWSSYERVVGGAIRSPIGQYIQYRATLTPADDRVTPSLDKVEMSYDLDTVAPSVAADAVQVSGTTASVSFSSPNSDIAGFECSLDGGAFAACTSPKQLTGLAPGSHTLAVRGIDKAGNVGAADSKAFSIASPASGGTTSQPSGGSSVGDTTAPKVSLVAKSLRASKKGTVSFRVGCPATEKSCKVTLKLKRAGKTAASKTVTVKGGKSVTVTLTLNKATRQLLKHGSLKVSAVYTATDAAGNHKTTTKRVTLSKSPA